MAEDKSRAGPGRAGAAAASAGWPKLILFDLDGTLIDSVPGIADALNALLADDGLTAFALDQVRDMVGHGFARLIERAYDTRGRPLTATQIVARHERMEAVYARTYVAGTTLMPGAAEFIAQAAGAAWAMVLVTNKPQQPTEAIMRHLGLADAFALLLGDSGLPLKPAPDMLLHAMRELGIAKADAVMVGDSAADVTAARAAGIFSIAVRGGYSLLDAGALGADAVIESLHDLPAAIGARADALA